MTFGPAFPLATAVTGGVLLGVFVIGIVAGAAKGRWMLLTAGIVAIAAFGVVLTAIGGGPAVEDPAAELSALYTITVPLVIAYLAGWLTVKGTWLKRFIVVGAAALLLAGFPYAAAGQATAQTFLHR